MAAFLRHIPCENCGSSDSRALYDDGSMFCFGSCQKAFFPDGYVRESKDNNSVLKVTKIRSKAGKAGKEAKQTREIKENILKEFITEDQSTEVKSYTSFEGKNYRGIRDEVLKFYGCRTELDEEGKVVAQYYPYTVNDKLAGYKIRRHPKEFETIGSVGNHNDLYGAFRFRSGGKYILITEGESDAHAAYQMFLDYSKTKNSDFVTAVVSIGTGAGNPSKQIAANYEFLNNFEHIILGMDADDVGRNSIEKMIPALPKGKVRIAKWTRAKDPNEYLLQDDSKTFLRDFYSAENYIPAGVLGSDQLYDKILEQAAQKRVSFPPFMKKLNAMLAGGLPLGHVVNLAAGTSIGKTTLVNEIVYYWLFHSPYKVGILSMENDAGQYGEVLLSRHISKKISLIADETERQEFLTSEQTRKAADLLFKTEDGDPRFYLVDDRDGTIDQLQEVVEQMVISSGCKIIVIDPIQDIFAGLSNEEQEQFMKWCKSMIKSHKITIILINHVRKAPGGSKDSADGARLSESDIHGSSTLIKSASVNILLSRNKMHEDEQVRNTTVIDVSKNRVCGMTGPAGALYYDNPSHTLFDYEDYFGEPFVVSKD